MQATETTERILMRKAKINWIKLVDGNNTYLYATVRGKNKQGGIHKLEDSNGRILTGFKDIEKEVIKFYKDLVGTTAQREKHVDIIAIREGDQYICERSCT